MDLVRTVFVLDDDEAFVRALQRMLNVGGFPTQAWTSVAKFLREHDPEAPGCLLIDFVMPEMGGLEVQRRLNTSGCNRPFILITGRGDMNVAVEGMRAGAVSVLAKPVLRCALFEALEEAMALDTKLRAARAAHLRTAALLSTLTAREREVLELVTRGLLNKQIASTLGISEKTIKVHRGRVMQKMQVRSAAALAQVLTYRMRASENPLALGECRA